MLAQGPLGNDSHPSHVKCKAIFTLPSTTCVQTLFSTCFARMTVIGVQAGMHSQFHSKSIVSKNSSDSFHSTRGP